MSRIVGANPLDTERRGIHAEGSEQPDVPPLLQVLAHAPALIERKRQLQRRGIQGRLQANRPAAQNCDPRLLSPGHAPPPCRLPRPLCPEASTIPAAYASAGDTAL